MDPNLFFLDWERVIEVLATIVVLSLVVERALSVVFEHRFFVEHLDEKGLKEPIAVGVAFIICRLWEFDALSIMLPREQVTLIGELVTALAIGGGSKGAIALFDGALHFRRSTAYEEAKGSETTPEKTSAAATTGEG